MTIKSFATRFGSSLFGVLILVSTWPSPVLAQHDHRSREPIVHDHCLDFRPKGA